VALVIELDEGHTRTLIGGGRYVEYDSKETVRTAELAFTVRDDFQGKGIGKLLMEHLTIIGRAKGWPGSKPSSWLKTEGCLEFSPHPASR